MFRIPTRTRYFRNGNVEKIWKTIGTNCQKVSALIGGTILPLTVSFVKLFALIQMNKGGKFLKKKKKHCGAASMGESRYYRVI